MSRLSIFRGDELLAEHVLMRAVVGLGRHPENDIVLDDRTLSRFHARVERRGDRYVVIDLGAQNGVHLNGQRITGESDLTPGDRIGLGRYVAIFDAPSAGPAKMRAGRGGDVDDSTRKARPGADLSEDEPDRTAKADDLADLDRDLPQAADLDIDLDDDVDLDPPKPRRPLETRTNGVEKPPAPAAKAPAKPAKVAKPAAGGKGKGKPASKDGDPFEEPTTAVEAKPAQPTFVLLYNGLEVSRHPVGDQVMTVGRSKQCDIVISLLGLSRKHATITPGDEGLTVEDLGSQNGTWVNNQRIEGSRRLRHGDLLNFYDYGLLFLEDGDVQVGFPGAGFAVQVDEKEQDILSQRPTHQGKPPVSDQTKPLRARQSSPALAEGEGRAPTTKAQEMAGLGADLDLGEGSFLGDEFEAEKSGGFSSSSLLDEEPADDDAPASDNAASTAILDDPGIDDIADVAVRKSGLHSGEGAFADGFEGESTGPDAFEGEKTSSSVEPSAVRKMKREQWPTDDELVEAMSNAADGTLVTLEVTLDGQPYTQMPLSQTVTRVGADPRCEFSLPRSSGLRPWHLTLIHLGSHIVCMRASPKAPVLIGLSAIDMAILRNGDEIHLGKRVRISVKVR